MTAETIFPAVGTVVRFDADKMAGLSYGPWKSEPWQVEWIDPETGIACELLRNRSGAWCGYVRLPLSHSWAPDDGSDGVDIFDDRFCDVPVHWGVTYAQVIGDTMCVGFDCAHLGDMYTLSEPSIGGEYRNVGYAKHETERLARHAKKVSIVLDTA